MDKKAELEMAVKMTEVVFAGIAKLIEVVSEAGGGTGVQQVQEPRKVDKPPAHGGRGQSSSGDGAEPIAVVVSRDATSVA